jgi:hypothetical protein
MAIDEDEDGDISVAEFDAFTEPMDGSFTVSSVRQLCC